MKNKKLFLGSVLMILAAVTVLPMLVGAAPGFPPPTGLTDANFNRITSGNVATTSLSGGTFYGRIEGVDAYATNANGMAGYFEALVSGQGVRGRGRGAYAGVAGYNDDATGQGVYGSSANGTGGKFDGKTYGVYGQTTTGTAAYFSSNTNAVSLGTAANSIEATGGIKNQNLTIASNGVISSPTGAVQVMDSNGLYVKNDAGATQTEISVGGTGNITTTGWVSGSSLYGDYVQSNGDVYAGGNLRNAGLTIAANGDISDTSGDVTINDNMTVNDSSTFHGGASFYDGGYNIYSGATKYAIIDPTGNFRTKGVVTAGDDDLLLASDPAVRLDTGGILMNTTGGIRNNYAGLGVNITDDLNVTGTIYDNTGNLTVVDTIDLTGSLISNGTVQAQGLVATNGLTATNYIGTSGYIYTGGNISSGGNVTASSGNIGGGTGFPSARVHGTGSTYGVRGDGSTMGGYFTDSDSGSYAYVAYGASGISAYGSTQGGYFKDSDNSGYARVGYGDRGVWGYGNFAGATFSHIPSGTWVDLGVQSGVDYYSVRGNGRVSGTVWVVYSDARLKDVIGDYKLGLNEIMQLSPVKFNYKKDNSLGIASDDLHVGLIAQDVQKLIPDAVTTGGDGILELSPDVVMFTAINAFKELKLEKDEEVASLRDELAELKTVVCELKPTAEYCEQ